VTFAPQHADAVRERESQRSSGSRRRKARVADILRGGNAAFARRVGRRVVQRLKIVNLASGTRPETLMAAAREEDTVLNVDSGHMLIADILRKRETRDLDDTSRSLKIKWKALDKKLAPPDGVGAIRAGPLYDSLLRDFVIRALFELPQYRGGVGVERLVDEQLRPREREEFRDAIKALEFGSTPKQGFARGSVEGLSKVVSAPDVDEVHVINALGFDLINDEDAIKSVAAVLKSGGKLVITSERTGMASKAIEWRDDKTPEVDDGKPRLKNGLELLKRFAYVPAESAYGAGVFEANYPGMRTHHTAGPSEFQPNVPFARLVFVKK
jgi:hypothetical protein